MYMNTLQINEILEQYKKDLISSGTKKLEDYELGFLHGLEYALAMHNKRPVIYVNADRTYTKHDKDKFPELFL